MAWTTPTYSGELAIGDPSMLRTAMYEIIHGITQRNDIVSAFSFSPGTGWYKADGTRATTITMADLDGMPMTGFQSYFSLNMQLIHTTIGLLASSFTTASGRSSKWTATSLRTAVGHTGSLPSSGSGSPGWQWAGWWQGWQDALDLLIYAWETNGTSSAEWKRASGTSAVDIEFAWGDAWTQWDDGLENDVAAAIIDLNITGANATGFHVKWIADLAPGTPGGGPAGDPTVYLARKVSVDVTPSLSGSIDEVWLDGGPEASGGWNYYGHSGDDLEIKFESDTDIFYPTDTDTSDGARLYTHQLVNGDFALGATSTFTIEILTAPPVSNPITAYQPANSAGWAAFFGNITWYVDISGELDDQA